MFTAGTVILVLKIAVVAVTVLLIASLVALWLRKPRWHKRLNIAVLILTYLALIVLEVIAPRLMSDSFDKHFSDLNAWTYLYIHLGFSIPAALMLPVMLFSGLRRWIGFHYRFGWVFLFFWAGTVATGVFFIPH